MIPLLSGSIIIAYLVIVGGALGRQVIRGANVTIDDPLERIIVSLAIGLGAFTFVPFLLLSAGVGTPTGIRFTAAALGLLALPDLFVLVRSSIRRSTLQDAFVGATWLTAIPFGVAVVVTFARALSPVTDDDGLSYHLTAAVRLLDAGRFIHLPTFTYTNWPISTEGLFAFVLGISRSAPVGVVQFLYGLLTIATICAMAKRLIGNNALSTALVLMMSYAVFWEEMFQAHVDVALGLYGSLAVMTAFMARSSDTTKSPNACRLLTLSALFAGLAATTKMTGIWVIGAMAIAQLLTPTEGQTWRHRLSAAVRYIAIAVCVMVPWLIRTWIITGNPVYPMLYSHLGGIDWTAQGWPRIQHYFLLLSSIPSLSPTPAHLLLSRLIIVSVCACIAAVVFRRTKHDPAALPARYAALFTLFVFAGSGYNLRFLLAAYPCIVLCGIKGVHRTNVLLRLVPVLGALFMMQIALRSTGPRFAEACALAVGAKSAQQYYQERLPDYPMVQYVNNVVPASQRILVGTWTEQTALYRPFALRPNYWMQDSIHYDNQQRLRNDLTRLGVTYLVLQPMDADWCGSSKVCQGRQSHETQALELLASQHGILLNTLNGVSLYKLRW